MSLDVSLEINESVALAVESGIFVRENGRTRQITLEEWEEKFPGIEPHILSSTETETTEVYSANITHNLRIMAKECGVYDVVWRPEENEISYAQQLIKPLEQGISCLKANPGYFKQFNPDNGWGDYEGLLEFLEEYLLASRKYPQAKVLAWR